MFILALVVVFAILGLSLAGIVLLIQGAALSRSVDQTLKRDPLLRRSGPVWLDVRLVDYRAPGIISNRRSKGVKGEVVLTESALVVFLPHAICLGGEDLSAVTLRSTHSELTVATSSPKDASGQVEVTLATKDVAGWVEALRGRGARTASK